MKVSFDEYRNKYQYDDNASEIRLKLKPTESSRGLPGKLYLGDYLASSFVQLKHRTCKYAVNCGGKDLHGFSREEGVTYLNIDPDDSIHSGDITIFDDAFAFIDNALNGSNNIVVFCQTGLSKSASIILYYIMKKNKHSLSEAIKLVDHSRKLKMRPDLVKVLMRTEKKMFGTNTIELGGAHNREILHTTDMFTKGISGSRGARGKKGGGALLPCAIFLSFIAAVFGCLYLITGKI